MYFFEKYGLLQDKTTTEEVIWEVFNDDPDCIALHFSIIQHPNTPQKLLDKIFTDTLQRWEMKDLEPYSLEWSTIVSLAECERISVEMMEYIFNNLDDSLKPYLAKNNSISIEILKKLCEFNGGFGRVRKEALKHPSTPKYLKDYYKITYNLNPDYDYSYCWT